MTSPLPESTLLSLLGRRWKHVAAKDPLLTRARILDGLAGVLARCARDPAPAARVWGLVLDPGNKLYHTMEECEDDGALIASSPSRMKENRDPNSKTRSEEDVDDDLDPLDDEEEEETLNTNTHNNTTLATLEHWRIEVGFADWVDAYHAPTSSWRVAQVVAIEEEGEDEATTTTGGDGEANRKSRLKISFEGKSHDDDVWCDRDSPLIAERGTMTAPPSSAVVVQSTVIEPSPVRIPKIDVNSQQNNADDDETWRRRLREDSNVDVYLRESWCVARVKSVRGEGREAMLELVWREGEASILISADSPLLAKYGSFTGPKPQLGLGHGLAPPPRATSSKMAMELMEVFVREGGVEKSLEFLVAALPSFETRAGEGAEIEEEEDVVLNVALRLCDVLGAFPLNAFLNSANKERIWGVLSSVLQFLSITDERLKRAVRALEPFLYRSQDEDESVELSLRLEMVNQLELFTLKVLRRGLTVPSLPRRLEVLSHLSTLVVPRVIERSGDVVGVDSPHHRYLVTLEFLFQWIFDNNIHLEASRPGGCREFARRSLPILSRVVQIGGGGEWDQLVLSNVLNNRDGGSVQAEMVKTLVASCGKPSALVGALTSFGSDETTATEPHEKTTIKWILEAIPPAFVRGGEEGERACDAVVILLATRYFSRRTAVAENEKDALREYFETHPDVSLLILTRLPQILLHRPSRETREAICDLASCVLESELVLPPRFIGEMKSRSAELLLLPPHRLLWDTPIASTVSLAFALASRFGLSSPRYRDSAVEALVTYLASSEKVEDVIRVLCEVLSYSLSESRPPTLLGGVSWNGAKRIMEKALLSSPDEEELRLISMLVDFKLQNEEGEKAEDDFSQLVSAFLRTCEKQKNNNHAERRYIDALTGVVLERDPHSERALVRALTPQLERACAVRLLESLLRGADSLHGTRKYRPLDRGGEAVVEVCARVVEHHGTEAARVCRTRTLKMYGFASVWDVQRVVARACGRGADDDLLPCLAEGASGGGDEVEEELDPSRLTLVQISSIPLSPAGVLPARLFQNAATLSEMLATTPRTTTPERLDLRLALAAPVPLLVPRRSSRPSTLGTESLDASGSTWERDEDDTATATPPELVRSPQFEHVLIRVFEEHKEDDAGEAEETDGLLSKPGFASIFVKCTGRVPSSQALDSLFSKHAASSQGGATMDLDDFLNFYTAAAKRDEARVRKDLEALGFDGYSLRRRTGGESTATPASSRSRLRRRLTSEAYTDEEDAGEEEDDDDGKNETTWGSLNGVRAECNESGVQQVLLSLLDSHDVDNWKARDDETEDTPTLVWDGLLMRLPTAPDEAERALDLISYARSMLNTMTGEEPPSSENREKRVEWWKVRYAMEILSANARFSADSRGRCAFVRKGGLSMLVSMWNSLDLTDEAIKAPIRGALKTLVTLISKYVDAVVEEGEDVEDDEEKSANSCVDAGTKALEIATALLSVLPNDESQEKRELHERCLSIVAKAFRPHCLEARLAFENAVVIAATIDLGLVESLLESSTKWTKAEKQAVRLWMMGKEPLDALLSRGGACLQLFRLVEDDDEDSRENDEEFKKTVLDFFASSPHAVDPNAIHPLRSLLALVRGERRRRRETSPPASTVGSSKRLLNAHNPNSGIRPHRVSFGVVGETRPTLSTNDPDAAGETYSRVLASALIQNVLFPEESSRRLPTFDGELRELCFCVIRELGEEHQMEEILNRRFVVSSSSSASYALHSSALAPRPALASGSSRRAFPQPRNLHVFPTVVPPAVMMAYHAWKFNLRGGSSPHEFSKIGDAARGGATKVADSLEDVFARMDHSLLRSLDLGEVAQALAECERESVGTLAEALALSTVTYETVRRCAWCRAEESREEGETNEREPFLALSAWGCATLEEALENSKTLHPLPRERCKACGILGGIVAERRVRDVTGDVLWIKLEGGGRSRFAFPLEGVVNLPSVAASPATEMEVVGVLSQRFGVGPHRAHHCVEEEPDVDDDAGNLENSRRYDCDPNGYSLFVRRASADDTEWSRHLLANGRLVPVSAPDEMFGPLPGDSHGAVPRWLLLWRRTTAGRSVVHYNDRVMRRIETENTQALFNYFVDVSPDFARFWCDVLDRCEDVGDDDEVAIDAPPETITPVKLTPPTWWPSGDKTPASSSVAVTSLPPRRPVASSSSSSRPSNNNRLKTSAAKKRVVNAREARTLRLASSTCVLIHASTSPASSFRRAPLPSSTARTGAAENSGRLLREALVRRVLASEEENRLAASTSFTRISAERRKIVLEAVSTFGFGSSVPARRVALLSRNDFFVKFLVEVVSAGGGDDKDDGDVALGAFLDVILALNLPDLLDTKYELVTRLVERSASVCARLVERLGPDAPDKALLHLETGVTSRLVLSFALLRRLNGAGATEGGFPVVKLGAKPETVHRACEFLVRRVYDIILLASESEEVQRQGEENDALVGLFSYISDPERASLMLIEGVSIFPSPSDSRDVPSYRLVFDALSACTAWPSSSSISFLSRMRVVKALLDGMYSLRRQNRPFVLAGTTWLLDQLESDEDALRFVASLPPLLPNEEDRATDWILRFLQRLPRELVDAVEREDEEVMENERNGRLETAAEEAMRCLRRLCAIHARGDEIVDLKPKFPAQDAPPVSVRMARAKRMEESVSEMGGVVMRVLETAAPSLIFQVVNPLPYSITVLLWFEETGEEGFSLPELLAPPTTDGDGEAQQSSHLQGRFVVKTVHPASSRAMYEGFPVVERISTEDDDGAESWWGGYSFGWEFKNSNDVSPMASGPDDERGDANNVAMSAMRRESLVGGGGGAGSKRRGGAANDDGARGMRPSLDAVLDAIHRANDDDEEEGIPQVIEKSVADFDASWIENGEDPFAE